MQEIQSLVGKVSIGVRLDAKEKIDDQMKRVPYHVKIFMKKLWENLELLAKGGWTNRYGGLDGDPFAAWCLNCADLTEDQLHHGWQEWRNQGARYMDGMVFRDLCLRHVPRIPQSEWPEYQPRIRHERSEEDKMRGAQMCDNLRKLIAGSNNGRVADKETRQPTS